MKIMLKKIPIAVLFFSLSFVFAKTVPVPNWVTDLHSVYSEKEYLAELGTGKNEDAAKNDALGLIISYLNSKITSETVSTTTATNAKRKNYSESATQKITAQSSAALFFVEYETYYCKKQKTYYAVAYINKAKHWEQVKPTLDNKKYGFEKIYEEAEKLLMASDPILAKKYFMSAKSAGEDFVNAIFEARLIVGDMVNVYSNDEKKIYEIAKKVKDAENATAIFLEIEGDVSGIVEAKVKSLFEGGKYNFTNSKKNCTHIMKVSIDQNKTVSGKGTEDEITTVSPSITLTIENPFEKQNLFSFSRKAEKGTAYTQDVAVKRGYENLCKTLESDLMKSFQEKMLEE